MLDGARHRGSTFVSPADYTIISSRVPEGAATTGGWNALGVAKRQQAAFAPLLRRMYRGEVREDFLALAQALKHTELVDPSVIEVGCGSGWNAEVLRHLLGRRIRYLGLDCSLAMTALGRVKYAGLPFVAGDACRLPLRDASCDVLLSGAVLMHLTGYEQALRETRRVARTWCILHTIPLLTHRPTTFLRKKAYGEPVVEVTFNEGEFRELVSRQGLLIEREYLNIPYNLAGVLGEPTTTKTFLCRVKR